MPSKQLDQMPLQTDLVLIPVCGPTADRAAHKGAGLGSRRRPLLRWQALRRQERSKAGRRTHGRVTEVLLQSRKVLPVTSCEYECVCQLRS